LDCPASPLFYLFPEGKQWKEFAISGQFPKSRPAPASHFVNDSALFCGT